MNISIKISSAILLTSLVAGCGSTPPMTAEEKAMHQALMNKILSSASSFQPQPQAQAQRQPQPKAPKVISMTEKELLAQKAEVDATGGSAIFSRHKDGIKINNQMFNDFEGSVANFGGNRLTGEFTYAVKNFDGTFTLKYNKADSEFGPIKIATVEKNGQSFNVRTVTGKTLPGSSVTPTSDGFIVGRAGSAFKYTIGSNNVKNITIMDGYHIAKHQNGDVASTSYILLEKDERSKSDSIGGLFDSVKDIGNTFGLNQVDHYVLVNINDGSVVPLDVSTSGKDVAVHSNCVSKGLYNKCEDVDFVDSLYEKSGLKNNSHYFWSINWINTKSGPLAFYKTTSEVKVVDINSKKVHTIFSRTLGVNEFSLIEHLDGKVSVKAKLGFSSDTIDNVEQFIQTNSENIEEMQTLETE